VVEDDDDGTDEYDDYDEPPRARRGPPAASSAGGYLDIWWGGTNSYFKYEFVLHAPAGLAWLSRTNKGDMVLTNSKWSCGPPAYRFFIMIPSAGDDIIVRAPSIWPIE